MDKPLTHISTVGKCMHAWGWNCSSDAALKQPQFYILYTYIFTDINFCFYAEPQMYIVIMSV